MVGCSTCGNGKISFRLRPTKEQGFVPISTGEQQTYMIAKVDLSKISNYLISHGFNAFPSVVTAGFLDQI